MPRGFALSAGGGLLFLGTGSSGRTLPVGGSAPVAAGGLTNQSFTENTGTQTYATASDFTGSGLTYSLSVTATGVTIDSSTGIVSVNTATAAIQAGTTITVVATNAFGSDSSSFQLTIVAASSSDIATAFGTLTAAGAGGLDVTGTSISSGDASGHFQIASGKLSPSSAGNAAGLSNAPYSLTLNNGQTISITTFTGWTARTVAEINAVQGNSAATLSGKRLELRRDSANPIQPSWALTGKSFSSTYTIAAADQANKPLIKQMNAYASGGTGAGQGVTNLALDGIKFYIPNLDPAIDKTPGNANPHQVEAYICEFGNCNNVTIQNCEFASDLPEWHPTNFPRPTQNRLCGISAKNFNNLTINDCKFYNIVRATNAFWGNTFVARRNQFYNMWGDPFNIGPILSREGRSSSENSGPFTIEDNVYWDFIGNYNAYDHPDFIQIYDDSNAGGTGRVSGLTVQRNIFMPGTKGMATSGGQQRVYYGQGIVMQGVAWTGGVENALIRGNIFVCDSSWGIGQFGGTLIWYNCDIIGNTIVPPLGALKPHGEYPAIRMSMSGGTVKQNLVCTSFDSLRTDYYAGTGATTVTNNVQYQLATSSPFWASSPTLFEAIFQGTGTDFNPGSEAEAIAAYRMKPNGALDRDNSGGPSPGDAGAVGTTAENGIANFTSDTINTGLLV